MSATIPPALLNALPARIDLDRCEIMSFGALCAEHDVDVVQSPSVIEDDAIAVVLPGWVADDGNAEVRYQAATSGEAAAQEYVDGGDWGDVSETSWVRVITWRVGYVLDEDGDATDLIIDREPHEIELEPEEPECDGGGEHEWCSPYSVLGGIHQNPGVWGHGGGIITKECCAHCGRYRIVDTWAQDPGTGTQGLISTEYKDADECSLAWVRERAARGRILALAAQYSEEAVNASIRALRNDEDAYIDAEGDARIHGEYLSHAALADLADEITDRLA